VGYCIGCPDIPAFVDAYDKYVTSVLDASDEVERPASLTGEREPWTLPDGRINGVSLAQTAYNPTWLLLEGNQDVMEKGYTATMHIDLLEGWRAGGWGRKLVEQFVAAVRAARGPEKGETGGIWIGIAPDNDKVVKFYERVGFTLWPGHGLRMVMDL
jgi:GNAT superfamily N-acetyltransferase